MGAPHPHRSIVHYCFEMGQGKVGEILAEICLFGIHCYTTALRPDITLFGLARVSKGSTRYLMSLARYMLEQESRIEPEPNIPPYQSARTFSNRSSDDEDIGGHALLRR